MHYRSLIPSFLVGPFYTAPILYSPGYSVIDMSPVLALAYSMCHRATSGIRTRTISLED